VRIVLTVERAIAITGRGIAIEPGLSLEAADSHPLPFRVVVRRQDGTELAAEAVVEVAHSWHPVQRAWAVLMVRGVTVECVPAGTRVTEE
jgi:hypothetical protein